MPAPFSLAALSLTGAIALAPTAFASNSLEASLQSVIQPPAQTVALREAQPEIQTESRLICKGCNEHENRTLAFLQEQGITDKNALATVMGNIRQESMFVSNICEGGARTSYQGCRSGGFGLIQWTSSDRYRGLGNFARATGGDPSALDTQLQYMITEPQWNNILHKLKTPGKSIDRYMNYAYRWLGWGVHGARTSYAYAYTKKLVEVN